MCALIVGVQLLCGIVIYILYGPLYISAKGPLRLYVISELFAAIGMVGGAYVNLFNRSEGFNVTNIAFTANKELKGLPFMGQVVYNPQLETTYFVVGLTF